MMTEIEARMYEAEEERAFCDEGTPEWNYWDGVYRYYRSQIKPFYADGTEEE